MNRFNDKSITQIAEELEISPRTVEKHIEIALKKLIKYLKTRKEARFQASFLQNI